MAEEVREIGPQLSNERVYKNLVKQKYPNGFDLLPDENRGEVMSIKDPREQVYFKDFLISDAGAFGFRETGKSGYMNGEQLLRAMGSEKFWKIIEEVADTDTSVTFGDASNSKSCFVGRVDVLKPEYKEMMAGAMKSNIDIFNKAESSEPAPLSLDNI